MEVFIAGIFIFLILGTIVITLIFQHFRKNIKLLNESVDKIESEIEVEQEEVLLSSNTIKNKIISSDKELLNYMKGLRNQITIKKNSFHVKNLDNLLELDKNEIEYGLIRINAIEKSGDFSKDLQVFTLLFLALLTSYNAFFQVFIFNENEWMSHVFHLFLLLVSFIYILKAIVDSRFRNADIEYFKDILLYLRDKKNN